MLDGEIIWAPALDGAIVMSTRGGDFELGLGQELSIGYTSHDAERVALYLTETMTFRGHTPGRDRAHRRAGLAVVPEQRTGGPSLAEIKPVLEPAAQTFADATDTPPYLFHMTIEDGRRTVGSVQVSDIPALCHRPDDQWPVW